LANIDILLNWAGVQLFAVPAVQICACSLFQQALQWSCKALLHVLKFTFYFKTWNYWHSNILWGSSHTWWKTKRGLYMRWKECDNGKKDI